MIISRKRFEKEIAKARLVEQEKEWMRHQEKQRDEEYYRLKKILYKLEVRLNNIEHLIGGMVDKALSNIADELDEEPER